MKKLTVLSLGAGVQSSTLALMAAKGEITPMPDCAIFADTHEPREVYDWLDYLEEELPFPVHRVRHGNIYRDVLKSAQDGSRVANPPLYTRDKDGEVGILMRVCTLEYKVAPILGKIKDLIGVKKHQRVKDAEVEQWIGISLDEVQRMTESSQKFITHRWPLIERRMNRNDCKVWLSKNDYPEPPRSDCTLCPYHDNNYWRYLRDQFPDEWDEACEFDKAIRNGIHNTKADALYLHADCVPLADVDLSTDIDRGQMVMGFIDDCAGHCGV